MNPRPSQVVFVCTANRIRSVFAERACKQLNLRPRWLNHTPIISRGIYAPNKLAAWPQAVTVAKRLGVDLSNHKSQALVAADLPNAWLLGMTQDHLLDTTLCWRAGLLGDLANLGQIPDPWDQPEAAYLQVFEAILASLQAWSRLPAP